MTVQVVIAVHMKVHALVKTPLIYLLDIHQWKPMEMTVALFAYPVITLMGKKTIKQQGQNNAMSRINHAA